MYAGCGAQGDHLMPSQNHRISCGALGDLGEQVHHRFGLVGLIDHLFPPERGVQLLFELEVMGFVLQLQVQPETFY